MSRFLIKFHLVAGDLGFLASLLYLSLLRVVANKKAISIRQQRRSCMGVDKFDFSSNRVSSYSECWCDRWHSTRTEGILLADELDGWMDG